MLQRQAASGANRVLTRKRSRAAPAPASRRRILVVGERSQFSKSLLRSLSATPEFELSNPVCPITEALRTISARLPGILLLGAKEGGTAAVHFLKELRASHSAVPVLVISECSEASYVNQLLRAGADGFVLREEGPEAVIGAIGDLLAGYMYISEATARRSRSKLKGQFQR